MRQDSEAQSQHEVEGMSLLLSATPQSSSEGQNLWLLTFQSMGYASEFFCSEYHHLRVLQRQMEHTSGLILVSEARKPGMISFL